MDFNPPAVPWFGGAWESLIKSTKRAMKAIMGNVVTVDEVFLTVVAEVESLLRPLAVAKPARHLVMQMQIFQCL